MFPAYFIAILFIFPFFNSCSADVGYQGRQQYVNLATGCWHMGTVAHEIGGKHTYKDWLFMLKEMTEELTKYY